MDSEHLTEIQTILSVTITGTGIIVNLLCVLYMLYQLLTARKNHFQSDINSAIVISQSCKCYRQICKNRKIMDSAKFVDMKF